MFPPNLSFYKNDIAMKSTFWIYFHENNFYLNAILLENHKILHGVEKYKYGNGSLISLEVQ